MRLILLTFVALFSIRAQAQYPSAMPNAHVREDVQADSNRVIPLTEHFAFTDDTDVFFRGLGDHDFYHGAGYWSQLRSEATVNPYLKLNVRSIFYNATNDAGYAQAGGNYHLLALTIVAPGEVLGGTLSLRGPDLDRQTMGAGLLIQDKEMNGALIRWDCGDVVVILRGDDTGLFRQYDDTYNLEVNLWKGYAGIGGIMWPQGVEQDHLGHERASYGYLFSQHSFEWIDYAFEAGERSGAGAYLGALSHTHSWGGFKAMLKGEYRYYSGGFANDFAGQIQQQYISYDQYDKDFTNAANVFVYGDNASVMAAHLNLWWTISHTWRLHSLNEVGQFTYGSAGATNPTVPYYYFRHGLQYCPIASRDDCLNLFFSNKVLTDSQTRPPSQISLANAPLFTMYPFVGAEIRIHL